jgi:hypothetical protein
VAIAVPSDWCQISAHFAAATEGIAGQYAACYQPEQPRADGLAGLQRQPRCETSGSLSSLWKEFAMAVRDTPTGLQRHNLAGDGAKSICWPKALDSAAA